VLAEPVLGGVIDLSRPACVILAAVPHFLPADRAAELTAQYMAALPPGSWLTVSFAHFADEELLAKLYAMHSSAPFQNHGTAGTVRVPRRAGRAPARDRGSAALAVGHRRDSRRRERLHAVRRGDQGLTRRASGGRPPARPGFCPIHPAISAENWLAINDYS
jgi:hypothetical protein